MCEKSLRKKWIILLFRMYSAMKMFCEVLISVLAQVWLVFQAETGNRLLIGFHDFLDMQIFFLHLSNRIL